jgi:hypothetical protein
VWLTKWISPRKTHGSDLQALTLAVQDLNTLLRLWLSQQGVAVPPSPPLPLPTKVLPRKRMASDIRVITREMLYEQEQKAERAEQLRREGRSPS